MTNTRQTRRSFMSVFASVASVVAFRSTKTEAAAQAPAASAANFDLRWIDELQAKHQQVFDMLDSDPAAQPSPLRLPRNYLDGFRDLYGLSFPDVKTIVGIAGRAFSVNASDRLWEKYALGERFQITDPMTKKPSVRNVFMDDDTLGVKALQARGTIFWQCNIALTNLAQQLAQARKMPMPEVRTDLIAGLNPGVKLVPSHVMAMGLVQERRVTYVKI